MRFGSLFTGIGGFDLGFERAGMSCTWQVEIDPFCRKILEKYWPDMERIEDVQKWQPQTKRHRVEVICGGFPCQDLSPAGRKAGLTGEKSGLWFDFARVVAALAPDWVVIENNHHRWRSWVPFVRSDLWELGYASLPLRLRASDFGAWHRRARCYLIAHADSHHLRPERWWCEARKGDAKPRDIGQAWPTPDTLRDRLQERPERQAIPEGWRTSSDAFTYRWPTEPNVGRMVYGLPDRVDRIRGLGNAVVPVIAEWVGRRIMYLEGSRG